MAKSVARGDVRLDLRSISTAPERTDGPMSPDEQPTSSTPFVVPAQHSTPGKPVVNGASLNAHYEKKRKTLILSAGISAVGVVAVIATLATAIKSSSSEIASTGSSEESEAPKSSTTAESTLIAPPETADNKDTAAPTATTSDQATTNQKSSATTSVGSTRTSASSRDASSASTSLDSGDIESSEAPATATTQDPSLTTTVIPGTCQLDRSMDPNLLYLTCPFAANTNAGFAMDKPCQKGESCVYACEPPYVCTENGFSDTDCVPYLGRCDPYSASTYAGGLHCQADGTATKTFPNKPLCALGLNTSLVTSSVEGVISSCQTVYPGNEAPMIGIELRAGETKQVTSFPQWYWHGTHNHFYVSLAQKNRGRNAMCQWNYDPLSLNSGGVDWMPYVIGGGSLSGHACSECGQHNLDFGENFDYQKAYSALPSFGVRVRNCNDILCGDIQCDATYRFDAASNSLEMYWAVYNTIYGADTVGCVADAVRGSSWSGTARDTDKFTRFEYYPIDITTGKQTANCSTCSAPSLFDASRCKKLKDAKTARFGTGVNPAMYVCTPTGGALALESKLSLSISTATNASSNADTDVKNPNAVAVQVIAVFALCAVATLLVVASIRLARQYIAARRSFDASIETPNSDCPATDAMGSPFATSPVQDLSRDLKPRRRQTLSKPKTQHVLLAARVDETELNMDDLRAATPLRRTSALASSSAADFQPLDG